MSIRKFSGWWRVSEILRTFSEVGGNAVLMFIITALYKGAAYSRGDGFGGKKVSRPK